jgi:hypothetical protein
MTRQNFLLHFRRFKIGRYNPPLAGRSLQIRPR